MQSLLPIMECFAFGSLVGGFYYLLLSQLRQRPFGEGIVIAILLTLPIIWSLIEIFSGVPFRLTYSLISIPLFMGLVVGIGGAFAERKVESANSSFLTCLATLWCAGLLGIGTSLCLLFFTSIPFQPYSDRQVWGLIAGIVAMPSAIPTFIYLWRTSKTRPGFDRHLTSLDDTHPSH